MFEKCLKKFLKSVSSVSDTVPPGCLHEDGFLENPRRLLKQTPGKYKNKIKNHEM